MGDKSATLHMEGAGYLGGGSRIVEDGTIEVECVVLDDFWKESGRIGLIKFDVEGFEEAALRGAEGLIRQAQTYSARCCIPRMGGSGANVRIV